MTKVQYAAFARSFHGASAAKLAADRAASSCSAVQAQGFSLNAERSAHAAETTVPPGQTRPTSHWVSAKVHPGGLLQVAIEPPQLSDEQHSLSSLSPP